MVHLPATSGDTHPHERYSTPSRHDVVCPVYQEPIPDVVDILKGFSVDVASSQKAVDILGQCYSEACELHVGVSKKHECTSKFLL